MLDSPARRRHRARARLVEAALRYAALGWACCRGAHPVRGGSRACSCDRIGCPVPGSHPLSLAWQVQASDDASVLRRWWEERPLAGIILPTGRVFDVFEVPAAAGDLAMTRIERHGLPAGPVAALGNDRRLFFVATRGAPDDEDEWWSSDLDVHSSPAGTRHIHDVTEPVAGAPGLRWHCRDSYVVAPPSLLPGGGEAAWLRPPLARAVRDARGAVALPDPLALLEVLADACEETAGGA
jgi:hypothetical protein